MKRVIVGILFGVFFSILPVQASVDSTQKSQVIELNIDEARELMNVAMNEAEGEGQYGMWLVMSTVINRKNDPNFPDTIHGVINQPSQYANFDNGKEPSVDCHLALAKIERGIVEPDIVAFETITSDSLDAWFNVKYLFKHHKFYVLKGED